MSSNNSNSNNSNNGTSNDNNNNNNNNHNNNNHSSSSSSSSSSNHNNHRLSPEEVTCVKSMLAQCQGDLWVKQMEQFRTAYLQLVSAKKRKSAEGRRTAPELLVDSTQKASGSDSHTGRSDSVGLQKIGSLRDGGGRRGLLTLGNTPPAVQMDALTVNWISILANRCSSTWTKKVL